MKKYKYILFVFIIFSIYYFISNNIYILVSVSDCFGSNSAVGKFTLKLIYKIPDDKLKIKLFKIFNNNYESAYINTYIRIAGVIGDNDFIVPIMKLYSSIQGDNKKISTRYYIFTSLGLFGNKKYSVFLEKILDHYDEHGVDVSRFVLARSIYLLTGNVFSVSSRKNEYDLMYLSEELKDIKKTLHESSGRKRSYREKLILDRLYHSSS